MAIDNKEVLHLAELSRLDLSPDEVHQFGQEIPEILSYVGKLQSVDTKETAPLTNISGQNATLREDVALPAGEAVKTALVDAFPEKIGPLLRVKSVFADRGSENKI
ncbi:MAG: Asp-tRNA(Asn)/Glu-tRNA(Gln) amidotransferase subunit GatC [bacterium]